eukprot:gene3293-4147_t
MANVRSRLPGPTPNPPPRHLEFKTPAARPAAAGYPPDDLLTLHDQVEALTDDLETHRAGESRLQSINMQLRQRLEEYQLQNKENVARAEAELTALQHDMEKTLRQQVYN